MSATSSQSSLGVTLRLWLPCLLGEVRPVARTIRAFLEGEGLHPEELMACELALTEACNNAVEHVGESGREKPVEVRTFCNGSAVEVEITDHSSGFDWSPTVTLPPVDCERGRGLYIIRSIMDDVRYLRGTAGNVLVLRKRRCYHAHRLSSATLASFKETRLKLLECQQAIGNMAKELCFRSETLAAIFRCSAELGRTHNLEDFSYRLLNDLVIITGADWFILRLVPRGDRQLLAVASSSEVDGSLKPLSVPLAGATLHSAELKAAVTGEDVWFDGHRVLAADDPIRQTYPNSLGLVHAFFFGDTLIGTLAVGRRNPGSLFSLEQTEVVHTFAEFLAIQVVNTRLEEERVQHRLVSHELDIARKIQRALLPNSLPQLRGFGLAAHYECARQVGGDFYDVLPVSEDAVWLVVADVMDKGVPAAMFAAILRTLVPAILQWIDRPSNVLKQLNRLLFRELSRVDMFITAQLVLLDLKARQMIGAGAGHCPVLVATTDEKEACAFASEGMPLGVLADATFGDVSMNLGPGCRVLLYTDGVTEASSANGEHFGQPRLMSWLKQTTARRATADALKNDLVSELAHFQAPAKLRDDQTFLILAQENDN